MKPIVWFCLSVFIGFAVNGCRGCSGATGQKTDASTQVKRPEPVVQPDAGVAQQVPVQPSSPATSLVKATPVHPLGLNKMPGVSRTEIEQDPRLDNPNLPYASKRTLKILEKLQKANPNLTKPDDWFKADPDADTRGAKSLKDH